MHQTRSADGQATVSEVGTVAGTSDSDWSGFTSLQQSTASYDGNGYKTKDVVTASSTTYGVTQYSYDADGRIECSARRLNPTYWGTATAACTAQTAGTDGPDRIAKTTYDSVGRVTKLQSAYGVTGVQADEATATFTDNGLTATATDAEGNKTSYTYDGVDRLSKTTFPSTTKGAGTSNSSDYEQLTYDAGSNVTNRRLRDGNSIGYSYDALSRLTAKDLPGSELDVAYTYDLLSRPLTAATSAQTVTFTYDALSRNLTQVGPQGTVTSAYDLAGWRTQLTYPGSFYVTYDHQVTGEVTTIKESGSTTLATYAYDDLGRRTTLTLGNGVVSSYGFDNMSRLTSLGLNLSGTTDDLTLGFSYNPASQITASTRSNDGYAWTGAANVTRAYTSNGLNQLTASGATSLGYDTRGNLTTSGSDTYTYSSENLLLTGPGSAALTYDPLLRLYQTAATGFTTTRFAYDGQSMIAEYNSSNALQKRYVFGPGGDEPLVEYDSGGTKTYLTADERGSVIARTNSSGVATAKNSYDEYGIPGGSNAGRFSYTDQTWIPELGMTYFKARMYSPTLGRFMQTDPIGYGDGMNWYNYVKGDPVNKRDASGLCDDPENPSCDIVVTGKAFGYCDINPFSPACNKVGTTSFSTTFGLGSINLIQICHVNSITVIRLGNIVAVSGTIAFPNGETQYLGAINSAWTGAFGNYNVATNMTIGTGGLVANIAFGPGGRPSGDIGGPNLNLNTLVGATPSQQVYSLWAAGHEFGHSFKLPDQYIGSNPSVPNPGHQNEIMGAPNGTPDGSTITAALAGCH